MKRNDTIYSWAVAIGAALAGFALGFFVCWQFSQPPLIEDPGTPRAPHGSAVLSGKIIAVQPSGEMRFQLVEWTPGSDRTEQSALESGRCDLKGIEQDECPPGGLFIRDTQKELTLPLSPTVRIRVLSPGPSGEVTYDQDRNRILRDTSLSDLSWMISNDSFPKDIIPFIITTKDGSISEIEEQYLP